MRRILAISRFKCFWCVAATRTGFTVLGICIAIVAARDLLVHHPPSVPAEVVNLYGAPAGRPTSDLDQFPPGKEDPATLTETGSFPPSHGNLRMRRALENAELAAGLVDSLKNYVPGSEKTGLRATQTEATAKTETGTSIPKPPRAESSQLGTITVVGIAGSFDSPIATKPAANPQQAVAKTDSPGKAPQPKENVSAAPGELTKTAPNENTPAVENRENDGRGPPSGTKRISARLAPRSGIGAHGFRPGEEKKGRKDYVQNEVEPETSQGQRAADPSPKAQDPSGDLQRFVSDFVRANQTDNVAYQHRFYADSVHFYGEGDLSWASVATATRRYQQERRTGQSEIAERAAVKGPVNGGFYVVEQPVIWKRSQGVASTRERSLLRLQVVPTDRGGWKITSIDEIKK